ncbi:MAG: Sec-independent protein translocase protein TatB [Myxococcota bacterium]
MFGLGTGEMLLIAVVAVLVIGPDRLPQAMRQLGRWYGQVRRTADDLRRAFVLEADRQDASERYKQLQERRKAQQEARKKAAEEAGGTPQLDPAAAVAGPPQTSEPEGVVPNDLPPDAPHPQAAPEVVAQQESR